MRSRIAPPPIQYGPFGSLIAANAAAAISNMAGATARVDARQISDRIDLLRPTNARTDGNGPLRTLDLLIESPLRRSVASIKVFVADRLNAASGAHYRCNKNQGDARMLGRMLGMTLALFPALGGCAPMAQARADVITTSVQEPDFNQAALDQILSEHPLFAGSVVVARQGRVIASGDEGQADRSAGRANGPTTRYSIGSIGKLVTAISVATLVRDGSLQWATPVVDIIPELAGRLPRTVTVDHLLRHRSGLDRLPDLDDAILGRVRDNHDWLSLIVESGIGSSGPGDFTYRNENYQILGEIVARASGRPYEDYVTASVLAPLRIRGPVFMSAEEQNESSEVARPYLPVDYATWWASETSITPGSADAYAYVAPASASSAGGGAFMSGQDLLALMVALADGAYGDEVSTDVLCEPTLLENDVRRRYARGCEAARSGDLLMMGHTGSTAGVQARAFIVPTERVVIVVLSNHDDQAAPVFDAIIARLGGGVPS